MATVKRRILDDQTFKEQTNTTNRMLASIAKAVAGGGGSLDVDDVVEFARLLGAGVGQICSVGKQFKVPKETSITVGTDKVLAFYGRYNPNYDNTCIRNSRPAQEADQGLD